MFSCAYQLNAQESGCRDAHTGSRALRDAYLTRTSPRPRVARHAGVEQPQESPGDGAAAFAGRAGQPQGFDR